MLARFAVRIALRVDQGDHAGERERLLPPLRMDPVRHDPCCVNPIARLVGASLALIPHLLFGLLASGFRFAPGF